MPETYIPLETAAVYEGVSYDTLQKNVKRNPDKFKIQVTAREGGGRDQVRVAVSSLSPKARKAHRAALKIDGGDVIIDQTNKKAPPWYITADLNQFIEGHKQEFYEAVELARQVQVFIDYTGPDKTGFAKTYAVDLGISAPSLYRKQEKIL
ncbi:MAG: transposase, partial [Oscillospiraceae bacterium]|nr:transposase [Oscillospiraceae bacterium]